MTTAGETKAQGKRKKSSLRQMADTAFEEAARLQRRNTDLARAGLPGYPIAAELAKAAVFEDIAKLIDALEPIKNDVARLIRADAETRKTGDVVDDDG